MGTFRQGIVFTFLAAVHVGSVSLSAQAADKRKSVTIDEKVPAAVGLFYQKRHFCSVADVSTVRLKQKEIIVGVTIDPRWARTLAKKDEALRQSWFSIHCPRYAPDVWKQIESDTDIVIVGQLPGFGDYKLGCRAVTTR